MEGMRHGILDEEDLKEQDWYKAQSNEQTLRASRKQIAGPPQPTVPSQLASLADIPKRTKG